MNILLHRQWVIGLTRGWSWLVLDHSIPLDAKAARHAHERRWSDAKRETGRWESMSLTK